MCWIKVQGRQPLKRTLSISGVSQNNKNEMFMEKISKGDTMFSNKYSKCQLEIGFKKLNLQDSCNKKRFLQKEYYSLDFTENTDGRNSPKRTRGDVESSMSIKDKFKRSCTSYDTEDQRKYEMLKRAFTPDEDGDIYLHIYLSQGETELAKSLIHIAPSCHHLDIQNKYLQTPLHIATVMDQGDVVESLILKGARIDFTDHHGDNIFHIIAKMGFTSTLQVIKDRCEDNVVKGIEKAINARNNQGLSPIFLSIKHKNEDVFCMMTEFDVDVNLPDMKSGESPLHEAVRINGIHFVDLLVRKCKANVNATDFRGVTPLHLAAGLGNDAINACLVMNGADINVRDYEGRRPRDVAVSEGIRKLLGRSI